MNDVTGVNSNNVSISLDHVDQLLTSYGQNGPRFKIDTAASIESNLNRLAVFALRPTTTLSVFYAYRPIFLDLVSRWIDRTSELEMEYSRNKTPNKVPGSIVLAAMSRLVGVSHECVSLTEHFVEKQRTLVKEAESTNNTLEQENSPEAAQADPIPEPELLSILLSYYRLLNYNPARFKKYVTPATLYNMVLTSSNAAKYLSIEILSLYFSISEESKNRIDSIHIDENNLTDTYEDTKINYKYIGLIEAKRLSNFTKLPVISEYEKSGRVLIVPASDLSTLVSSVCGVLVPNFSKKDQKPVSNDLIHSSNTLQDDLSSSTSSTLVPIESSVSVLRTLAHLIQHSKPVMLYGQAGAGKTFLINQLSLATANDIVKIHLGEQTDSKLLLGTYTSGDKPGTFKWKSGVLTNAVKTGKWVLIEDIDKAPTEVLSVLLTLLEKRQLVIPSRGEVIHAKNGFQLFATVRLESGDRVPDLIGLRLWEVVKVNLPTQVELKKILTHKFPLLANLIPSFLVVFASILKIYSSNAFMSLNRGAHPRVISLRDLMKFCSRCQQMLVNEGINSSNNYLLPSEIYDNIFAEAIDCFGSSITEVGALEPLVEAIGEALEIPTSRINLYLKKHIPVFVNEDTMLRVGRSKLVKSARLSKNSAKNSTFAKTNHSLRLMEQICVAIHMIEPVLLVGETGTGKTTVVQQVAQMMNKKLTVINVSQQTESGDLLGGYKPVNTKMVALPLLNEFTSLFSSTFSKKNDRFTEVLGKCFQKGQWKNVIRLWKEAVKMALALLSEADEDTPSKKKRRLSPTEKSELLEQWKQFSSSIANFGLQAASLENSFVFDFIEGALVAAVRNGDWLLLDEINLASSDTLESIADLLGEVASRSVLLTEKGDLQPVIAHPEFRIFGCMNPSTDVGKKDLPVSIRSRFSEIYVHSPDRDMQDLLLIIDKYISRFAVGDEWVGNDIAELYLEAKRLSETNAIVDGANQKAHFSIRTLTRTLVYVRDIVSIYGLRRSLYEGFCMSFLTLLDAKSESVLKPLIEKHTLGRLKNIKSIMRQNPPAPSPEHVQFKHYWMKRGPLEPVPQPNYIITPFVEKNMLNLVRATAGRRFPVLIQGPTSSGKTSMIGYLASITGHKFVRINNHEHTDLQEYLGTYISDSNGKLVFKEGVLVEALRKGHWIVLDELNLAPTDVLEALNRLLDDNRELFIPETQEVVHPHPDFMLFATQNPAGMYGGRKAMSRAFRNRFLELHFDDIPQDELEVILKDRCKIAPTYGKKIVEVYKQLSVQRQSSRLFEQKNSFATLRDLFRWALRDAVGYEELAANGYMLLAERVRNEAEKLVVKTTIENVMRVKLDMDAHYAKLEDQALLEMPSSIVWTKAMRRLAVLVSTSMKYHEPLLLVGETGCGKTSVCQIISLYAKKQLVTINAHQNTETGDILGAQRPVRNKYNMHQKLLSDLQHVLGASGASMEHADNLDSMLRQFDQMVFTDDLADSVAAINEDRKSAAALFEWVDGPLVQAMKTGDYFLLDEISLADDSVLERLNSVLEPERSLYLAEKGTDDAFLTAAASFEFLATMNPGGDYGKKELSPALRNRFTEIWVPSMADYADVREIVDSKLNDTVNAPAIVSFAEWFANRFGGAVSLRDILAWVEFVNVAFPATLSSASHALLDGACMVFIDSLGTNNTAYLAENEVRLNATKIECVSQLSKICGVDLTEYYGQDSVVTIEEDSGAKCVRAGAYSIACTASTSDSSFNLNAPTTARNAMRVVRALQLPKPILLEGSPGVGKTSLVTALATASGNALTRINLSEQTDLVDLFGSDAPAEGGKTGEFAWRDAPFLRAMKRGEWVLLDEMNLASQSVLEGLNACLDHRGEAYIPELDMSFAKHAGFRVFAAQNPQHQGGGRKGLPKSFVNRFSVVYVDVLKQSDLMLISNHLYSHVGEETVGKIIKFVSALEAGSWGSGGPWEFNLRDTLRWLELYSSKNLAEDISPSDFLQMVVCQRFRSEDDRRKVTELFTEVWGEPIKRDANYTITPEYVQIGGAVTKRSTQMAHLAKPHLLPLQCNVPYMETALRCINSNLPLIITGPTNSGKTELVRFMANIVGAQIEEFAMNSDVDSMDILGGYEQVDYTRRVGRLTSSLLDVLNDLIIFNLGSSTSSEALLVVLKFVHYIKTTGVNLDNYNQFHEYFAQYLTVYSNEQLTEIFGQSAILQEKIATDKSVRFEWFDGMLVQAVERGSWLILDNANLCSPSVLDRLNSLLETNGALVINECSGPDGAPRTIQPHPNFRLFLTVDPRYGELSRAMRNRGIEIFMDALPCRLSQYDSRVLARADRPVGAFISATTSFATGYAMVDDIFEQSENSAESSSIALALLSFANLRSAQAWHDVVLGSAEFSAKSKSLTSDLLAKVRYILESATLPQIYKLIEPVQLRAGVRRFAEHQSIHPLLNAHTVATTARLFPSAVTSESNYLFEVVAGIIEAEAVLTNIKETALNGKLADLNYVQRSAAFHLGRNIKSPPRLEIFPFIEKIRVFVENVFLAKFTFTLNKALYELQSIWRGLVGASSERNESKLRIFQELVLNWVQKFREEIESQFDQEEVSSLKTLASDLLSSVSTFSAKLVLASGFSIDKIWEATRDEYPNDSETWAHTEKLLSLAAEFDLVILEQFPDTNQSVSDLRSMILSVFDDLKSGMSTEDFEQIYDNLKSGIDLLTAVSEKFLIKRKNTFRSEFTMISNLIELSGASEQKAQKVIDLASYSDVTTVALLAKPSKPFPSILNKFWWDSDSVSGLFLNNLLTSSLHKVQNMPLGAGKYVQQSLSDSHRLGSELVENSGAILVSQIDSSRTLLFKWIAEMVSIHSEDFKLANLVCDRENTELLISTIEESGDEDFKTIARKFIIPALVALLSATSVSVIGKAWILFSCGAIQLYVPSSSYDPAIREYVLYQKFQEQQAAAEALVNEWASARSIAKGDQKIYLEELLPSVDSAAPSRPRVYRTAQSVDQLFEEWKAFLDSTIDVSPIEKLLQSVEDWDKSSLKKTEMFQNNSNQFLLRLHKNYLVYSDLNDILSGYVYGLKFGFSCLSADLKNNSAKYKFESIWPVNITQISSINDVTSMFENAKVFAKSLSVDSTLPENIMSFFMKLSFAHKFELGSQTDSLLESALQTLYYRWSLRRIKEEEDAIQSGSLYTFTDTDDSDEEFKRMFPDHEDIIEDSTASKHNDNFDELYYEIAKAYIGEFGDNKTIDLKSLLQEGSVLAEMLHSHSDKLNRTTNTASALASLLLNINENTRSFTTTLDEFDFYRGTSPRESKRAIGTISNIQSNVLKLLAEWPEHATLQNISLACDEYLSLSVQTPVSRLLQKIEQIYTFINEWEKYASSVVSMKVHFDELTSVIVSWRKLELSTWKALFKHEERTFEQRIGKWWFYLFETVIINGETEEDPVKLLSALNLFMSQSTYGEYTSRLGLLVAFRNHILRKDPESQLYESLANFIHFYQQFTPLISEAIAASKVKLEKDINEVILLASWKDVNIEALKQSAKRSHNSLYKLVRKYRAVLKQPVSPLIESGLSSEHKSIVSIKELPLIVGQVIDPEDLKLCSTISNWPERPSRLQDLTIINKNMELYVNQITSVSILDLYEYSKTIIEDMEALRNETPKELKKDNKKLIAALKTQKRKLLSDTLKELRRMGLKTSVSVETIDFQTTVNNVLCNANVFDGTVFAGCDVHFFRVLDLLPRMRASISALADDVPPMDAQKGLAVAENLVHSLMITRKPLRAAGLDVAELQTSFGSLEVLSQIRVAQQVIVKSEKSTKLTLKSIGNALEWLPRIMDFAVEVSQASCVFGASSSLATPFLNAKYELSILSATLNRLDSNVFTEEAKQFVDRYQLFKDDLERSLLTLKMSKGGFIGDIVLDWMQKEGVDSASDSAETNGTTLDMLSNTLNAAELAFRELTTSLILSVQRVKKCINDPITEDTDNWLKLSTQQLHKMIKSLQIRKINKKISECIAAVSTINHDASSSAILSALASFTLPVVREYYKLCWNLVSKARVNYTHTAHATFILSTSLLVLATKGFCSPEPPTEQKDDKNLSDGTGLGDGDGEENNSKDVGDDEDLSEQAQQENKEKKEKDEAEDDDDDAVDIEGDMVGDVEEASDQEKSDPDDDEDDQDMDEEVDDIDDSDPNAIDEKMWDEEAKDENEKDSENMPQDSNMDDDMEAGDDDQEQDKKEKKGKEDQKPDADQAEEDKEGDEEEGDEAEDGEDGEEEDVGEQEDEVKNDENEKIDDHVPETETLDLPEDMNLDGDEEEDKEDKDEEEDDEGDDEDDAMDIDEKEQKQVEEEGEAEEGNENSDQEENSENEEESENPDNLDNLQNEEGEEEDAEQQPDEVQSDDELGQNQEPEKGEQTGEEAAEGVDGANEQTEEDLDKDSSAKQEQGEKGDGADNQVVEENDDLGATGGASSETNQKEEDDEDVTNQDDARDQAKESLKQLGDSLKEFHRRRQEIKQASAEQEEQKESAAERPDEFEHVDGENADFDTQALGAADNDQIQKLDEDMAIDDEIEADEPTTTEVEEKPETDQMDVDGEEVKNEEAAETDADFEGKTKGAFIGERKVKDELEDALSRSNMMELDTDEEIEDFNQVIEQQNELPPIDIATARELWKHSELSTQELASGLCEQLRLILEPTLATKLKGDYKTGKRLNMKRIITYIASEFRKDKIWLRRTKPSKRQYQIMIAVDDSKSMSESKSTELAFHSIALVSKALTQLESGGLSIVRFGEDIKVVHPFDKPFNNQESGARIFQWFDFQQTRTDIKQLCSKSLKIFEDARSNSNDDLWQLQIIISDGVCEDHETIQRMVRRAREEKVMLVFVIIDGISSKESILDMSQVSYATDANGSMKLQVDKYLDTFPFEFYVVVRNINELPEMLSLILRQYFQEVSNL